jgi:hypothetical protein
MIQAFINTYTHFIQLKNIGLPPGNMLELSIIFFRFVKVKLAGEQQEPYAAALPRSG